MVGLEFQAYRRGAEGSPTHEVWGVGRDGGRYIAVSCIGGVVRTTLVDEKAMESTSVGGEPLGTRWLDRDDNGEFFIAEQPVAVFNIAAVTPAYTISFQSSQLDVVRASLTATKLFTIDGDSVTTIHDPQFTAVIETSPTATAVVVGSSNLAPIFAWVATEKVTGQILDVDGGSITREELKEFILSTRERYDRSHLEQVRLLALDLTRITRTPAIVLPKPGCAS